METLPPLPVYPSTQARKGLSASQLAHLYSNLSNALAKVIELPPAKQNTPPTHAFISSYASDAAQQILEALVWEDLQLAKHDDRLRQRVLLLAEKLSSSSPGLGPKTLLDLCVAFPNKITRLRSILAAALGGTPNLPSIFTSEVVPAFRSLLSPSRSSGLYGLRKTARCLTSLLRPSPPDLVRSFAHDKDFLVALARAYDDGLAAISRSYGGIRLGVRDRHLDSWETIWLNTKVDIIDAFHIIVTTMVRDISRASGTELAVEVDRAFGVVFALLGITPQSTTVGPADTVPFLDRSLIADYQYAYDLSKTLSSALRHASRDDARMRDLESTLRSFENERPSGGAKDPGALKLLLRSSGIAPRFPNVTAPITQPISTHKAKAKATTPEPGPLPDADLDMQVVQVLDIFPDHSPEYIRKLLTDPSFPFRGNPESVIEALLEGTAPGEDELGDGNVESIPVSAPVTHTYMERRNVFDDEVMDLSRIHVGKKTLGISLGQSRAEKEQIIRLTERMSVDSDEETWHPIALDVMDLDDDEAGTSAVKILGDGEDSDDEVDPIKPETILELAYIRDSKLFNRDAETRRSNKRAELKQQTGWTDEQIEGWKIMLERNPKKERILQKHGFSGNRTVDIPIAEGTGDQPSSGQRSTGRGGGRGRGRGRGRGQGRGSGEGGGRGGARERNEDVARERAFKEKHKSSNRTRGHDKKMRKAGVGPSE